MRIGAGCAEPREPQLVEVSVAIGVQVTLAVGVGLLLGLARSCCNEELDLPGGCEQEYAGGVAA
jgi:hypothetical protein